MSEITEIVERELAQHITYQRERDEMTQRMEIIKSHMLLAAQATEMVFERCHVLEKIHRYSDLGVATPQFDPQSPQELAQAAI